VSSPASPPQRPPLNRRHRRRANSAFASTPFNHGRLGLLQSACQTASTFYSANCMSIAHHRARHVINHRQQNGTKASPSVGLPPNARIEAHGGCAVHGRSLVHAADRARPAVLI
jgi:hypothetical protein